MGGGGRCGLLVRIGGRVNAFIPCGLELRASVGDVGLGCGLFSSKDGRRKKGCASLR